MNSSTKILRLPAVLARIGIGKTAVYAAIRRGDFPKPVKLSARAVGWRADEVDEWISGRSRASGESATIHRD